MSFTVSKIVSLSHPCVCSYLPRCLYLRWQEIFHKGKNAQGRTLVFFSKDPWTVHEMTGEVVKTKCRLGKHDRELSRLSEWGLPAAFSQSFRPLIVFPITNVREEEHSVKLPLPNIRSARLKRDSPTGFMIIEFWIRSQSAFLVILHVVECRATFWL